MDIVVANENQDGDILVTDWKKNKMAASLYIIPNTFHVDKFPRTKTFFRVDLLSGTFSIELYCAYWFKRTLDKIILKALDIVF